MEDKQVSYAIHGGFYKKFFPTHNKTMNLISELNFTTLKKGYTELLIFYSSYSYYLKDDEKIKEILLANRDNFRDNKKYRLLLEKTEFGTKLFNLSVKNLIKFNDLYYLEICNVFEIFEGFCNKLAPNDIMPSLTDNISEHEKNVLFASYDLFYEYFYNYHSKIAEMLSEFNIINFIDIFRKIQAFYYGYSHYLSKSVKNKLKDSFNSLWKYYNDENTIWLYILFIKQKITPSQIKELKSVSNKLLDGLILIYEIINEDLPKKNIMPKRKEQVLIDTTLI